MRYIKAEDALPGEVIALIQQYVDGVTLYIPRKEGSRRPWGCDTAYRAELEGRNREICCLADRGVGVTELAARFHLSEKSIRRILKNR